MSDWKKIERELRNAQRRAESEARRAERKLRQEVDKVNRENQRRVDAYNRRVDAHNKREVEKFNRGVRAANQHNQRVDAQNRATISGLSRVLNNVPVTVSYTPEESALVRQVASGVKQRGDRQCDVFLSYARIDGSEVGECLRQCLETLGVSVWFDELSIQPGASQSRQMDSGLAAARAGVVLLTPAYVAGRFWTERELGALLHKDTLIPVLHGITFEDIKDYSGILSDLAGFETARDSVGEIAEKIAVSLSSDLLDIAA